MAVFTVLCVLCEEWWWWRFEAAGRGKGRPSFHGALMRGNGLWFSAQKTIDKGIFQREGGRGGGYSQLIALTGGGGANGAIRGLFAF